MRVSQAAQGIGRDTTVPYTTSLVVVALAIAFTLTQVTIADTHYVSKTGSNTFPYSSWATAADTVARAVEAAAEWDTILIDSGHYATDTVVMKRGQILQGAGIGITLLDTLPSNPFDVIICDDSCTIRDVTLKGQFDNTGTSIVTGTDHTVTIRNVVFDSVGVAIGANQNDASDSGYVCLVDGCSFLFCHTAVVGASSNIVISNCRLTWDQSSGGSGAIFALFSSIDVANSVFRGVRTGPGLNSTCAIRVSDTYPTRVMNNLFASDFLASALELNTRDEVTPTSSVHVINNTMVGWNIHLETGKPGTVFKNNVCTRANSAIISGLEKCVSTYNLTWDIRPWDSGIVQVSDTIPNDLPGNTDNFDALPMFSDSVDYLLQSGSPAIDSGDPLLVDPDSTRSDRGYAGGPGGFTYPYVDLAPLGPADLQAMAASNRVDLIWSANKESDLLHYLIYRDTASILSADTSLLLATLVDDTTYRDSQITLSNTYYYRVAAVDIAGNGSTLSNEVIVLVSGVDGDGTGHVPTSFGLSFPRPNPFNGATSISVTVGAPGTVHVYIYDVRGARVATLWRGPLDIGTYEFRWIPKKAGSGLYFVRAKKGGDDRIRKLLYIK